MLDISRIRQDFPILNRKVHGKDLVYLDNAATTHKPRQVIDALMNYYGRYNANIHRGIHALAEEATQAYEDVREQTAGFIGASSSRSIVFTRNATESINLVANSWAKNNLKPGDEVLLTQMEHHANLIPWQMVSRQTGAKLVFIGLDDEGRLKLKEYDEKLSARTKLVALTHISNVLGTVNPVEDIAGLAHKKGSLVLIDAAQSVAQIGIDVNEIDCDFLVFSAHKMLGPTGVGVLYAREDILENMEPFLGGGEMIKDVTLEDAKWNDIPWKFEAGTPNIADVIAFGKAIEYLRHVGFDALSSHERQLTELAISRLDGIENLTIYGPKNLKDRAGIISFNIDGLHPHDVGTILDHEGVAVRAGHHCAKPLMRRLGVSATVRASFYLYNSPEEIERLILALKSAIEFFKRPSRVEV